jgi:ketosteroid isomerase-like protein
MSQQDVDTFRRSMEAWNRGDFETWIELYDPDVEWLSLVEEYRGHAGLRQAWQSLRREMQIEIRFDDVRDLAGSLLALGEVRGTGPSTGLNLDRELAAIVEFRAGRAVRITDFPTRADGLEAAGLSR